MMKASSSNLKNDHMTEVKSHSLMWEKGSTTLDHSWLVDLKIKLYEYPQSVHLHIPFVLLCCVEIVLMISFWTAPGWCLKKWSHFTAIFRNV